jgi:hypothetical protein
MLPLLVLWLVQGCGSGDNEGLGLEARETEQEEGLEE